MFSVNIITLSGWTFHDCCSFFLLQHRGPVFWHTV